MTNISVIKFQINNLYYKKQDIFIDFEKNFYRKGKKFVYFGSDDCDSIFFTDEDFEYYHPRIRKFYKENNLSGRITVIKDGKLIKKRFRFNKNDRETNPIRD